MTARSRLQKLENELTGLETRFEALLLASLRRCEQGRWGMFGTNDSVYASFPALAERLKSKDGTDLLIESIDRLRTRLGYTEPNSLCKRFLDYRRKRGSNDLGEPKLAAKFLAEIEQDEKITEGLRVDNPIEV
jgi:hypothetical protein